MENMDVDSMTAKVKEVIISDEEGEVITIDIPNLKKRERKGAGRRAQKQKVELDLRWAFVGWFLTERFIRLLKMSQILAANWRPSLGVVIQEVTPKRFLFHFNDEVDIYRIVEGGHLAYDNHLLMYERIKPGDSIEKVELNKVNLWVQIHNLLVGFLSKIVDKWIGAKMGTFVESDLNNFFWE